MKNEIKKIIESEDPYNPYKDEEIAKMLQTTRSNVVHLRKNGKIDSYDKRRKPFILSMIRKIVSKQGNISTVNLTEELNKRGFDVSRFLVASLRNELFGDNKEDTNSTLLEDTTGNNQEENPNHLKSKFGFNELIGENGSIKRPLQLMKAAMLYPPHGLNTIIVGETGTGKSKLVETVYKKLISKGEILESRKLIKFNCANYANNPELLVSQLFGHVKGSFTGADKEKDGIIKEANGGILFLDEIHRLSSVGQEMLFSVIDDGKYYKLGQNSGYEIAEVMIIGATTENINSTLLRTFKRRIPMIIELPSLANRDIHERFQLILMILQIEANNINKKIKLDSICLVNLLTYYCQGNIGQLQSDIKAAIASSYLQLLDSDNTLVEIKLSNFPKSVQVCDAHKLTSSKLDLYRDHGILIKPKETKAILLDERRINVKADGLLNMLQSMYTSFQEENLPELLISQLIYREIKYRISRIVKEDKGKNVFEVSSTKLKYNKAASDILFIIEEEFGILNDNVKDCLIITLQDFLCKYNDGWEFPNISLECIEKELLAEYRVALEAINKSLNNKEYRFPQIIVGVVAVYIHFGYIGSMTNNNFRVVVIMHGKIATAIADICNYYVCEKVLNPIDIPTDLSKEKISEYVIREIYRFEEDNILLLVDVGNTLLLGEIITQKTNKNTKTIGRVDLGLALEAAIMAKKKDITLIEIYDYLRSKNNHNSNKAIGKIESFKNLIIVTCITGQGAANNIKTYIKENFKRYLSNIEIMAFGVVTSEISDFIKSLMNNYKLIVCIGSYNIDMEGVPFINISELAHESGKKKLISLIDEERFKVAKPKISKLIYEDAIFFDLMFLNKTEAINNIANKLYQLGYVNQDYISNVIKREEFSSTDYKYGIAIPHTGVEYVNKSVVSITKFSKQVIWNKDYYCDIMFMLALKKEDIKVIKELRKIVENKEFLNSIYNLDKNTMFQIINAYNSD